MTEPNPFPSVQIRYVAHTGTGHTPSRSRPELWVPEARTVPWVTLADVWQLRDGTVDTIVETNERISEQGLANSAAVLHPRGTVLLSRTASVGFSAVMGKDMAVSQDFMTWTPGPLLLSRYLLYVLRSQQDELRGLMYGSTHKTIYMPDLLALRTPLPPREEQHAIVAFLDRECERLYALQGRLAEARVRLSEVALSRFTELTQPLPPTRLGLHFEVQLGKMVDEGRIKEGQLVPYLRNQNIAWDAIDLTDVKEMVLTPQDRRRFVLRPGDLLACEGRHVGKSAVWDGSITPMYYQKALHRIRPRAGANARYLMWCLRLGNTRGDFYADGTGSTIPHLPAEKLRAVRIPYASDDLQRRVVDQVDACDRTAQAARCRLETMQLLLDEYRDALITEAVTGQLDVRHVSESQMDERLHAVAEDVPA